MSARELAGREFGRLTVLERAGTSDRGEALWHCRCACGGETTVKGWLLHNGQTRSCGCLRGTRPGTAMTRAERKRAAQAERDKERRSWVGRGGHAYELRLCGVPVSALEWARRAW